MVRRVAVGIRIELRQADDRIIGAAAELDEAPWNELVSPPLALAQIEVPEARHGIDVGVNARAELAALHAENRLLTIGVRPPGKVIALDAKRGEDALEHDLIEVAPHDEGYALGQPVRPAVRVAPLRPGLEDQRLVATGLLEAGGLCRKVPEGDLLQPACLRIALGWHGEAWVAVNGPVLKGELAVGDGEAKGGHANGLGG